MVKKLIFVILSALMVFFLADNDAVLYHAPVATVLSVSNKSQITTDEFGNHDTQVTQTVYLQLLNQTHEKLTLTSISSRSEATTPLYKTGQQVILTKENGTFTIQTLKRDALILALFTLFSGLLLCFIRLKAALFLLLSLAANFVYYLAALSLNLAANNAMLLIFSGLCVLFVASSCAFVLGFTRQMLWTLVTTLATMLATFLLVGGILTLTGNSGIHFEYLDYVTLNPELLFFAGTLISVLGAIMDACSDIVVGLFGVFRQNPALTTTQLFRSGRHIGEEIIGTLTGVLFMIFMAETLPMTLLLLRNGNNWNTILTIGLNLGIFQTLISAIGILLALPISSALAAFSLTKRRNA
ncbi:MAG: YibE/F family protein [Streptococcaceae bacterium]|jgi:uncharacterized membrane protein|nr:YibE/F family protein [Streptococcaceae bacterium]